MDRPRLLPLVAALLLASPAAPAAEPEPGRYRISASVQGPTMPAGSVVATTEECLTAEDLSADPRKLVGELPGTDGCTLSDLVQRDGKLAMTMRCSMEGMEMRADSRGTYRSDGYDLTTTMRMDMGGMVMEMQSSVTGERIGDC